MLYWQSFVIAVGDVFVRLIAAVAWPLAVFAVAHLFRNELRGLLSRVRSMNWRSGDLQLDEAIQSTRETLAAAVVEEANEDTTQPLRSPQPQTEDIEVRVQGGTTDDGRPVKRKSDRDLAPPTTTSAERRAAQEVYALFGSDAEEDRTRKQTIMEGWNVVADALLKFNRFIGEDDPLRLGMRERLEMLVQCRAISERTYQTLWELWKLKWEMLRTPGSRLQGAQVSHFLEMAVGVAGLLDRHLTSFESRSGGASPNQKEVG